MVVGEVGSGRTVRVVAVVVVVAVSVVALGSIEGTTKDGILVMRFV